MSQAICRIRLWCSSRDITMSDGSVKSFGLTFVADDEKCAQEICDIHGLTFDGECMSIIDDNNGGELTTLYDAFGHDSTSFDKED